MRSINSRITFFTHYITIGDHRITAAKFPIQLTVTAMTAVVEGGPRREAAAVGPRRRLVFSFRAAPANRALSTWKRRLRRPAARRPAAAAV